MRRFRHDPTRFERSQQPVHRGGGIMIFEGGALFSSGEHQL